MIKGTNPNFPIIAGILVVVVFFYLLINIKNLLFSHYKSGSDDFFLHFFENNLQVCEEGRIKKKNW